MEFACIFVACYFLVVWACQSPDRVMEPAAPKKAKPEPGTEEEANAGRDALFAKINTTANWMFASAVVVGCLAFLFRDFPW